MNIIEFKTIVETDPVITFLAQALCSRLERGENVAWLVAGGSSIPIAVAVAHIVAKGSHKNLTVTLTDERYGPVDHPDSNWYQLIEKGFSLPEATLIPVLTGENQITTVKNFNTNLARLLEEDSYKIGLFGIGTDGHTAGILPESIAIESQTLACGYSAPPFERITITPKAIAKLDEGIVYAVGESKWPTLAKLGEEITMNIQPAQALKRIPKVIVFTDYQ